MLQPRFLVVEDDPLVARSLAGCIARFGTVLTALNHDQAAQLLADRLPWAGFVVDLKLPDGSGLELLKDARSHHRFVPAILLSGRMNDGAINGAFAVGAKCLCKPWPPEALQNFAREALATQQEVPRRITEAVAQLANKHGLTRAQTDILLSAVRGIDRASIVAARHVSENTHKTQVRGILRKTQTLSLGELRDQVLRAVGGAS